MGNSNSYPSKEMMVHAVDASQLILGTTEEAPIIGFANSRPKRLESFQLHQSPSESWVLKTKDVTRCRRQELFPDGKYYTPYKGVSWESHLPFVVFVPV